jgi:hypothetical protein
VTVFPYELKRLVIGLHHTRCGHHEPKIFIRGLL